MNKKQLKYFCIVSFLIIAIHGDKFNAPIIIGILAGIFGDLGVLGIVTSLLSISGFFYLWVSGLKNKPSRKDALRCIGSISALTIMLSFFIKDIVNSFDWYCYFSVSLFLIVSIFLIKSLIPFLKNKN